MLMSRKNPNKNTAGRSKHRKEKIVRVLSKRQSTLTIVAENISDIHNFSAMLRSCDAVGVFEVYLVYNQDIKMPKLGKKSSASAKKWINIKKFNSIEECYEVLRKEGKKIFTTHLSKDAVSLYELDLTQNIALVFGNEHNGVSEEAVKSADGNFLIPQVGMIQSLNISVACAVSLYEAFRQRQIAGMYDKIQFPKEQYDNLIEKWMAK